MTDRYYYSEPLEVYVIKNHNGKLRKCFGLISQALKELFKRD